MYIRVLVYVLRVRVHTIKLFFFFPLSKFGVQYAKTIGKLGNRDLQTGKERVAIADKGGSFLTAAYTLVVAAA